MNRSEYRRQRALLRKWKHNLHETVEYQSMADSRLVVQISADHATQRHIRQRIAEIQMRLPSSGTDPLGFRTMYQNWARRRSHVAYRCRARRRDAGRMVRHAASAQ